MPFHLYKIVVAALLVSTASAQYMPRTEPYSLSRFRHNAFSAHAFQADRNRAVRALNFARQLVPEEERANGGACAAERATITRQMLLITSLRTQLASANEVVAAAATAAATATTAADTAAALQDQLRAANADEGPETRL